MRRITIGSAGFLTALLLGFICNGCNKSDTSPQTSAPPPLTELRLGYFANITHAQAVLEVASGELQTALGPVQLKTKVFNAGPELMQALNAGEIDIGYVGPGPVISEQAISHGQAIRVIAGSAANGVIIVARKDAGIVTMADLKGKRIATPQLGNTQDVSARHYVTAVLGQADANNVVPVPNSQQAGLMAVGKIDAAWTPEPWGERLIDQAGAVLIAEEKDLWPDKQFTLTVVVTTPEFLAAHPDVIQKVLTVHHSWTQRLQTNPQAYAGQLGDALSALSDGKKLSAKVLADSLKRTQFTDDPLPGTFSTMGQWSADLQFVKAPPDLTGLFETGIIRQITGASPATSP
ncbi:MAG: ABC transporter substrate-binding protein [Tepidisphaeraceae bacterium]|jgi:NitT/TauT family transport system substrate-binding protein